MPTTISENLRCAATAIRLRGHTRKSPQDNKGRICAAFAIFLTAGSEVTGLGSATQAYFGQWLTDHWGDFGYQGAPWKSEPGRMIIQWSDNFAADEVEIATFMEKAAAQYDETVGL